MSHSLSPRMHAAAFRAAGLDLTYRAIRVRRGEVATVLAALQSAGYAGVNVTVPHKEEAREAVRSCDAFSERCGSVNTIRLADLHGINTDGVGFIDTLEGLVSSPARALLLGAGGTARAIALSLALEGYNLAIFNRTRERAALLVRELGIEAEVVDEPALRDFDLIVNATSASLRNEALDLAFDEARKGAVAYDLVYGESRFLEEARAEGLKTVDGKGLLVCQGARSFEFWLGFAPDRAAMLEAVS